MPQWVPLIMLLLVYSSFTLLIAAIGWGLWGRSLFTRSPSDSSRWFRSFLGVVGTSRGLLLIVGLVAILMGLPAPGNPRYALPALALFLPLAGRGIAHFELENTRRFFLSCLGVLVLVCCVVANVLSLGSSIPSSYYLEAVESLPSFFDSGISADVVIFQVQDEETEEVSIRPVDSAYIIEGAEGQSYRWQVTPDSQSLRLTFIGIRPENKLQIEITSGDVLESVVLDPIQSTDWQTWQPAGATGVEYRWIGR